ncbi:hypothetical protein AB0E62_07390 [Streptomyces sp. NPDC038707]|uniref:RICIN domain-containing protein n=1 Tax=unclassified Streptomyces TaxID=2593676 RepID=UPI003401EF99
MDDRVLALRELRTLADLNTELRELKARSRLTYRQLEERAAEKGELLPRSTLADVLRNGSLPRQELLAAFVRACGEGEYVDDWLAARQRAAEDPAPGQGPGDSAGAGRAGEAAGGPAAAEGPGGPGVTGGSRDAGGPGNPGGGADDGGAHRLPGAPDPVRRPLSRGRRTRLLVASLAAVALVSCAVWFLWLSGDSGRPDSAPVRLPRGQVLLRPFGSPGLCVTDGQVPDGRYHSVVAVQRPCDRTAPQTTTLEPVGENAYRISWYHPDQGKGCLKVLTSGPGKELLEPWDACERTTAFRFTPAEPAKADRTGGAEKPAGRTYLIRTPDGKCVGIRSAGAHEGTEAVVQPCTGADTQLFLVEAVL